MSWKNKGTKSAEFGVKQGGKSYERKSINTGAVGFIGEIGFSRNEQIARV